MNNEIVKPENSSEIHTQHSHGSDMPRVEMLKSYNSLKKVAQDSESSTRNLLANSVQNMSAESVVKLPKLDSVKKRYEITKKAEEYVGDLSSCANVIIPSSLKVTHRGIVSYFLIQAKVIYTTLTLWDF